MQFNIKASDFKKYTGICQRIISGATLTPMLSNILVAVDVEKNNVRLVSTDLEVSVECIIPAEAVSSGEAIINSKLIAEVIDCFKPEEELEIVVDKDYTFNISSRNARYRIFGLTSEDYPTIHAIEKENCFDVEARLLVDMIKDVIYAVGQDESKPYLCGVFLRLAGNTITVVTTDGRRLAMRESTVGKKFDVPAEAIVPAKVLNELTRLGDIDGSIEVHLGKAQAGFRTGNVMYFTRLIAGQFPDYRSVIPTEARTTVIANTAVLRDNLKGTLPVAKENSFTIKFVVEKNSINLSAKSARVGDVTRSMEASVSGDGLKISFNARFLLEAISQMTTDEVEIRLNQSSHPALIKPAVEKEGSTYINVLMPIRTV